MGYKKLLLTIWSRFKSNFWNHNKTNGFLCFFDYSSLFDQNINQIDHKTAFVYSLIDQLVFIEIAKKEEIKGN